MTFEKYKLMEFKGDALAKFIAIQLVDKFYPNSTRTFFVEKVNYLVSNKKFEQVAQKLKLSPHAEDYLSSYDKPFKSFANAFEAHLWDVYVAGGLDIATEYFRINVMPHTEQEAQECDTSKAK